MLFRFSFSHVSGYSSCYNRNFDCLEDAKQWVRYCLQLWGSVESVTLDQYLTDDSCGPIKFIGTFIHDGFEVINRDSKQAL